MDGVDARKAEPPEIQSLAETCALPHAAHVGVGEDESGECEEQVNPEAPDVEEVREDGNVEEPDPVEGALQVVEEYPGRCNESDSGQLPNEHVHVGIVSRNYSCHVTNPRLLEDLLLSRAAIERAAHLRADGDWQRSRTADPRSLVVWVEGSATAVASDAGAPALHFTPVTELDDPSGLSFLGVGLDDRAYFAAHPVGREHAALPTDIEWSSLRTIGGGLSDLDAGLTVTAVALDNWRARTRWCSACGSALVIRNAGWSLGCEADGIEHFPRTDPAVIVLVRDQDDRALLGRHVNWPVGRMSTFAGFVEAGESAEAAVRRELTEETGVVIGPEPDDVEYLGSQPWPFPCSLMLGYHARASQTEITVDGEEIAEAHWYSRAELLAACESGEVTLPSPVSISRKLIERWYGSGLPGEW